MRTVRGSCSWKLLCQPSILTAKLSVISWYKFARKKGEMTADCSCGTLQVVKTWLMSNKVQILCCYTKVFFPAFYKYFFLSTQHSHFFLHFNSWQALTSSRLISASMNHTRTHEKERHMGLPLNTDVWRDVIKGGSEWATLNHMPSIMRWGQRKKKMRYKEILKEEIKLVVTRKNSLTVWPAPSMGLFKRNVWTCRLQE